MRRRLAVLADLSKPSDERWDAMQGIAGSVEASRLAGKLSGGQPAALPCFQAEQPRLLPLNPDGARPANMYATALRNRLGSRCPQPLIQVVGHPCHCSPEAAWASAQRGQADWHGPSAPVPAIHPQRPVRHAGVEPRRHLGVEPRRHLQPAPFSLLLPATIHIPPEQLACATRATLRHAAPSVRWHGLRHPRSAHGTPQSRRWCSSFARCACQSSCWNGCPNETPLLTIWSAHWM